MGQRLNPFGVLQVVHLVRQDLSIAGKRAGLAGARSGLFMEQIRIVREMRERDKANGRTGDMVRPRFMVWENVPGAFSSNKGQDFAAVLEEIIRIAEPEAPDIEVPEKGWNTWGGYHDEVGGRWSVAWRVHDAQYWGVPQRRRRIALVADFGGDTAGEILFERKSVSGYPAESGAARERLAGDAQEGSSYAVRIRGGCDGGGKGALVQTERSGTLGTGNDQTIFCLQGNGIDRADTACGGNKPAVIAFAQNQREEVRNVGDKAVSLAAEVGMHCQTFVALDMSHACDVIRECGEQVLALQARMGTGGTQIPLTYQMQGFGDYREGDVASSCKQRDFKDSTDLVCSVDCRNFTEGGEINGTLQAKESSGQSLNLNNTIRQNMVVRRLTPMECERLQGFPDHWTDIGEWYDSQTGEGYWVDSLGKRHKTADSPRYKALGNSIALPFWDFLAKRISAQYPRPVTMGSLFDGISGFCLCFARWNGVTSCRWASEIEEFPIAVAKKHFGDEETGEVGDIERILRSDEKENV